MNKNPKLPYGDGEFDFVTNVVSVDYLVKPQEVGPTGRGAPMNGPTIGWSSLGYIYIIFIKPIYSKYSLNQFKPSLF